MNINTVPISRGWDWISEGFGLFRRNPLIWIVNFVILLGILSVLSMIPLIGSIGALLLQPVLVGGLLIGCRALEQGQEFRIEHLFDGFNRNTNPLVMVGVFTAIAYFCVGIVIFLVVAASVGLSALGSLADQQTLAMGGAMLGFVLSGLIGLALALPIAMATWFAPALVVFDNQPALESMKASFIACLRNLLPFLLYGIAVLVLGLLAMIPFGLGLLVLGPTLIASVYAGYRDIFTP